MLGISRSSVQYIARLLAVHRLAVGTRTGRRSLGPFAQAILVCRFLLEAARVGALARDNGIGRSTAYRYLHEALGVLAAQAPSLSGALLAAHAAGYDHVNIDGTLIATTRVATPGPTTRRRRASRPAPPLQEPARKVDLWWSGKHHHHGGNVQVRTRPGRVADLGLTRATRP